MAVSWDGTGRDGTGRRNHGQNRGQQKFTNRPSPWFLRPVPSTVTAAESPRTGTERRQTFFYVPRKSD